MDDKDDIWGEDAPIFKMGFNDAVGAGLKRLEGRLGALERRVRDPTQEAQDKLNEIISNQKYQSFLPQEKEFVIKTLMTVPNIHLLNPEASLDSGLFINRFYKRNNPKSEILTESNLKNFSRIIQYNPLAMVRYTKYLEEYFRKEYSKIKM